MNLAALSIKRPIFISSIVILMLMTGWISLTRLGVDLFPDVNIPVVVVSTVYVGAGPEEVETLISKPLEEELSSISGLKRITSRNQEGISQVFAEFNLSTDIKYAEQQVRDKTARARVKFPDDAKEPLIIRYDPADQPVLRLSVTADLPPAQLYDVAKEEIKVRLEQVANVGNVTITGGTRREIQVELDRHLMNTYEIPAVQIAAQLKNSGVNVPAGKFESGPAEVSFRTIGRFESVRQIENTVVFFGADIGSSVLLKNLARVRDSVQDETTLCYLYAPTQDVQYPGFFKRLTGARAPEVTRETKPALFIDVYKQSGTNTVAVADAVMEKMRQINDSIQTRPGKPRLILVQDRSKWIRANVEDVAIAIILGILLAVTVVYLFLGNIRSTIITGLALPNSLLGAFILMKGMDFTVNVMTLLALSLSIGLLVDDAIVVRENIFRKLEEGMPVVEAAERGTVEVTLAVIATSATVIAVFLPVGFLTGMVGQFFKQFGLTVVFAMIISLFDALTVAPMLSAYFAGRVDSEPNAVIRAFNAFQKFLDNSYVRTMRFALKQPWAILILTFFVLAASIVSLKWVKKTFLPPNDQGEFMVSIEMPPGTSLRGTYAVAQQVETELKKLPEMDQIATIIGSGDNPNNALLGILLVPAAQRSRNTQVVKLAIREMLAQKFPTAKPRVNDYSAVGGVQFPFNLNIKGDNIEEIGKYAMDITEKLKAIPDLVDLDTNYRTGKPEFQIQPDLNRMQAVGILPGVAGSEIRYHIAGDVVGKFHENGLEYDVLMRLRPEQRNLRQSYIETRVPNMNMKLIPLSAFSSGKEVLGPSLIVRQDRSRVVTITANLAPTGAIDTASTRAQEILTKFPPPPGVSYVFIGQSEDFKELLQNVILAFGLALIFIYLVLSSLYESFITPITILFAIPPAISGAFYALLIFGEMLNIFSMIGVILLMGLVTKNSILLVDMALHNIRDGMDRDQAILVAGEKRLRPILMTSIAMIAGTMPIALGLGEAAKARTAMGIAIIGGLVLSTGITLIVVPAIFKYVDRFREFVENPFRPDYDMAMVGKLEEIDAVKGRGHKRKN